MHTEMCFGLLIAHFPSLMHGFIMQHAVVALPDFFEIEQINGVINLPVWQFSENSPNLMTIT